MRYPQTHSPAAQQLLPWPALPSAWQPGPYCWPLRPSFADAEPAAQLAAAGQSCWRQPPGCVQPGHPLVQTGTPTREPPPAGFRRAGVLTLHRMDSSPPLTTAQLRSSLAQHTAAWDSKPEVKLRGRYRGFVCLSCIPIHVCAAHLGLSRGSSAYIWLSHLA